MRQQQYDTPLYHKTHTIHQSFINKLNHCVYPNMIFK